MSPGMTLFAYIKCRVSLLSYGSQRWSRLSRRPLPEFVLQCSKIPVFWLSSLLLRLEELQSFLLYKNRLTYLPYALLNLKKLTLLVVSGDHLVEIPTALCDSSTPLKWVDQRPPSETGREAAGSGAQEMLPTCCRSLKALGKWHKEEELRGCPKKCSWVGKAQEDRRWDPWFVTQHLPHGPWTGQPLFKSPFDFLKWTQKPSKTEKKHPCKGDAMLQFGVRNGIVLLTSQVELKSPSSALP
jgi:hypothetical protein